MTDVKYPSWQKLYQAALLEQDKTKLAFLVSAVEDAIFLRLQEISNNSNHFDERIAIDNALSTLRILQVRDLGYPDGGGLNNTPGKERSKIT